MEKDKAKEEGTEEAAEEDDEPAAIRQYKKMTSVEKAETSTADSKAAADAAQTDVSFSTCQSTYFVQHYFAPFHFTSARKCGAILTPKPIIFLNKVFALSIIFR